MFNNLSPIGTAIFIIAVFIVSVPLAFAISDGLERKFGKDISFIIIMIWALLACGKAIFS